jgi:hypothetical protein
MHGYEKVPDAIQNYIYKINTGKTNCHNHLLTCHAAIYDKTIWEKKWPYCLSTEKPGAKTIVGELCKCALPPFTLELFIEYLVCFIVANNQASNFFLS